MRAFWLVLLACILTSPSVADDTAFQKAFAVYGKQYAPYDIGASKAATMEEKRFLSLFFTEVARAGALRVSLQQAMEQGGVVMEWQATYAQILHGMRSLRAPENLYAVQTLIVKAVENELEIFIAWKNEGWRKLDTRHPRVGEAHRQLIAAYTMLRGFYPQDKNERVFYDHLCTLDFI